MIRKEVTVTNRLGLHARAAARFVQTASRYRSRITLGREGRAMDGKSILGILLLVQDLPADVPHQPAMTTHQGGKGRFITPVRKPFE